MDKRLIEEWLPVAELGAEAARDKSAAQHPPPNRMHVWWARRPLVVSRAAVLGSLLPAWGEAARKHFNSAKEYQGWFLRVLGILGDPVRGAKAIAWAKANNVKLTRHPYGYDRAFKSSPDERDIELMRELFAAEWGTRDITMSDPMSGGGSIPFEALRLGLRVIASELNPVASVILRATLEYPAKFGESLAWEVAKWGAEISKRARERLGRFYHEAPGEKVLCYVWARTVPCPYTGKPVPLSPNWWLLKGDDPVAARPIFRKGADEATFEIVRGKAACEKARPDFGTVGKKTAISPWANNQPIEGDYIKKIAQEGRMGQQMYALCITKGSGREFRLPTDKDLQTVQAAEKELKKTTPAWNRADLIPREQVPEGSKTSEALRYGLRTWADMFSPRQLLALGTYLELLREIEPEIRKELPKDRADGAVTLIGFVIDKCLNYNSRMSLWHSSRGSIANTFDRHDFAFKWSHGEFDAARNLWPWALDQIVDSYSGIARLVNKGQPLLDRASDAERRLQVRQASATQLSFIPDKSLQLVCVDPPYYANVMYAELSDFFYVWLKRSVGHLHPDLFREELTNKDEEAVANVARFANIGSKKKKGVLAKEDYERKMTACFREMRNKLRDEGMLTIMFTHKETAAWDSLATALINAGFAIHSSWPVRTESKHSLHQAKKSAAASTIILACRKRPTKPEPSWWDDLKDKVRRTALEKAEQFERLGITGVDLYISTFGPVLALLSESWPVLTSEQDEKTGQAKPLRPEQALDVAREAVLSRRGWRFDPATDWYLHAWDAFKAREFPADEARKLALALGLNLESAVVREKRIVTKKGQTVAILEPNERRRKGIVDPDAENFGSLLDAIHTAMLVFKEDGPVACGEFLKRTRLIRDGKFRSALGAMLQAVPSHRKKGQFVLPEFQTLEGIRSAYFDDLPAPPPEGEPEAIPVQMTFPGGQAEADAGEEEEEDDES